MLRYALPLVVATAWATPQIAHADLIPIEKSACGGKDVGQACDLSGTAGVCAKSTCTKNDYSDGVPPKSVSYDCVVCDVSGKADDAALANAKPEAEADDTKAADGTKVADEETQAKTEAKQDVAKPASKSGCSVGGSLGGAWLGLLGLMLWRRRD